jgi:peptide/nickel transport system substrate-binding protein
VSSDGLVYTLTLRRGVKFHNGKTLDAKDVVSRTDSYMAGTLSRSVQGRSARSRALCLLAGGEGITETGPREHIRQV